MLFATMPTRRLPISAVLLALVFWVVPLLRAQPSHVQASLVAAAGSIQPGQPFTVALHFVHDPHWHTYWVNPGTGLATSLTWKLPPGFTASDLQWPAPSV